MYGFYFGACDPLVQDFEEQITIHELDATGAPVGGATSGNEKDGEGI